MFIVIKKKHLIISLILVLSILMSGLIISRNNVYTSGEIKSINVPIIMYHSLLKESSRSGKYVLSPEQLEKDIVFLKDKGYTPIFPSELLSFDKLPEKPVILTFDDGYYNNYLYAFPILKKYNAKALLSVIGKNTDINKEGEKLSGNYSHVTYDQIKEMVESKLVEIGNHTYDMHTTGSRKGCSKKRGESDEDYKKVLTEDVMKLQNLLKEKVGITPVVFTYPFGSKSSISDDILSEMGFKISLSCEEKMNILSKDDSLFSLKRYNRPSGISSESFFSKIIS